MPAKQPKMTDVTICSMLHELIDENVSLSAANRKLAHGRIEAWINTYKACGELGISGRAVS